MPKARVWYGPCDSFLKRNPIVRQISNSATTLKALTLILGIGLLSSCGDNTTFREGVSTKRQVAPGSFFIPPSVDLLLVQDDSGSGAESFAEIQAETPLFLNQLQERGWDFHFTSVPLTGSIITPVQVVPSYYDGNWALNGRTGWLPLFPGATAGLPGLTLPATYFIEPWNYSRFITQSHVTTTAEAGFTRVHQALTQTYNNTGFLRPGAISVVLLMSNSEDTSEIAWCTAPDNSLVPCAGEDERTYGLYETRFQNLENQGKTADFRFFSLVAQTATTNCLNGSSRRGSRYLRMATHFDGGASNQLNICNHPVSGSINGAFDAIAQNLEGTLLSLQTEYVAVATAPNFNEPVTLTKYINGDANNAQTIPQNAQNGWTYVGYQASINSITAPFSMRPITGYIFRLNGSAKLVGLDTIKVDYIRQP